LDAIRVEGERLWIASSHVWTASTAEKKRFVASYCDEKWIHYPSVEDCGVSPTMHQHRQQSRISMHSALYLVGSAGSSLLWAAQTERNHHGRSLSTTIDAFESSIEGKTAAIQAETWQSDFATWQRSATYCTTGENLFGNA